MPSSLSAVETQAVPDVAPSYPATVNDLAIRVGTVNGSGSQSANLVLLRALLRDGHPVQRQERLPLEHRGAADVVPHPGQRQGLRRATGSTPRCSSA